MGPLHSMQNVIAVSYEPVKFSYMSHVKCDFQIHYDLRNKMRYGSAMCKKNYYYTPSAHN